MLDVGCIGVQSHERAGARTMVQTEGVIAVVDDDEAVRRSLARLLRSMGWDVTVFASAEEFLPAARLQTPACLILDVKMPGQTGLELQEVLREVATDLPIIFISGHAVVEMVVRAMRGGAIHFLPKPFAERELLLAVEDGVALSRERLSRRQEVEEIRTRMQRLTPRQRQVMRLVVRGMLNKQIAMELQIAEKTVKVHRAQVMEVMEVASVAELVRAVVKADPEASTISVLHRPPST